MTCAEAREGFSALIDDVLTPPQRAALDVHLRTCAECPRELERFRTTVTLLREVERPRAPAGFVDRVLAAARPEPWPRRLGRWLFVPLRVKLPVEAVAVGLVAVGAAYVVHRVPEMRAVVREQFPNAGRWPEPSLAPVGSSGSSAPSSEPVGPSSGTTPAPPAARPQGASPSSTARSGPSRPARVPLGPAPLAPSPPDPALAKKAQPGSPTRPAPTGAQSDGALDASVSPGRGVKVATPAAPATTPPGPASVTAGAAARRDATDEVRAAPHVASRVADKVATAATAPASGDATAPVPPAASPPVAGRPDGPALGVAGRTSVGETESPEGARARVSPLVRVPPDLAGRLAASEPAMAERELGLLVARLGGRPTGRRPDPGVPGRVVVELEVPRGALGELWAGLERIGRWTPERQSSGAEVPPSPGSPTVVRIEVSLGD